MENKKIANKACATDFTGNDRALELKASKSCDFVAIAHSIWSCAHVLLTCLWYDDRCSSDWWVSIAGGHMCTIVHLYMCCMHTEPIAEIWVSGYGIKKLHTQDPWLVRVWRTKWARHRASPPSIHAGRPRALYGRTQASPRYFVYCFTVLLCYVYISHQRRCIR